MASTASSSSLLRTKNTSKLVKRFLQRTSDYDADKKKESTDDQTPNKKKRRREERLKHEKEAAKPVDVDEIVKRHIKTLLVTDRTMNRPPTKASKKHKYDNNKHKIGNNSNAQVALSRLERENREEAKLREKAEATRGVLGSSRSSASQHQVVHEPTFNKKRHAKHKKEESLKKIAKLLQKQAAKKKAKQQKLKE